MDYTKENYTTALWFSEGVTTTAANFILLRAGLLNEARYLRGLAAEIGELERRPAHLTQSAEESSLDTWLEKYSYYHLPTRSISYYNKGNLLGVVLDLQVREATNGSASLRDVFWLMNQNAQKGQFFSGSEGVTTGRGIHQPHRPERVLSEICSRHRRDSLGRFLQDRRITRGHEYKHGG